MDKVSQDVYAAISHDLEDKQKEISVLQKRILKLKKELACIADEQEEQAQYSRRNCVVIYGVEEKAGENTDEVAMELFKSKLDVEVKHVDIDRSHRLTSKQSNAPRPLIVKFARHNVKQRVYAAKKKLKPKSSTPTSTPTSSSAKSTRHEPQIFIREHLTVKRQKLIRETLNCPSVMKAWTIDGRIRALAMKNDVISVRTVQDLQKLSRETDLQRR